LLVADLGNAIRPRLDRPYALFGHSLGALIAFELVRWLEDRRSPAPLHLFVAGGHAPVTIGDKEALHLIADDEEFLDAVGSSYGSIPPTVRNNPELKQIVTATLRADMTLAECYDGSDRRQISADITAYAGLDDRCIEESKVLRWRECTKGEFSYQCCRGDHFFVHEADAGVTGRVGRRLALCT
jgi:surfactin synthase thioesterase subunit